MKEVFGLNVKKVLRDLLMNGVLLGFLIGGLYIFWTLGEDEESRVFAYFFLACALGFSCVFLRNVWWLLTAKNRYISVDDKEIVRSWNGKVDRWVVRDVGCEISLIKTRDAGNLIALYLVGKDGKKILLTENDWIGNFTIDVSNAIQKRQGFYK